MSVNELWDTHDAERMYDKLRAINPHLPDPQYVQPWFKIKAGRHESSTITLDVVIKLPVEDS